MDNLEIYNKVRKVPKEALKPILAGRLKGKSDINPMWRLQVLTETFGPCGFGWKYEIVKQWIEEGGTVEGITEKAAFVNINLYVKSDDKWSDGIPGTGGSSFVAKEGYPAKDGKESTLKAFTSDECFKMALTDAISVSCKALGVAADVYWEHGSKYTLGQDSQNKQSKQEPPKQDTKPEQGNKQEPKNELETRKSAIYFKCINGLKWTKEVYTAWLKELHQAKSISTAFYKNLTESDITYLEQEYEKIKGVA